MSLRVAIVVTHLLGVGHLARAAAIARAMAAHGHQTMLISGGNPAAQLLADGVEIIQLPALHVVGTAFSDLRQLDGAPVSPETAQARLAAAITALQRLQPDVLITELFPFGRRALGDEFRAILAATRHLPVRPLILASVRDILARPEKLAKIDAAHALLRSHYDGVLVHSDPALVPLEASWPIAGDLKSRLHYTGYVDDAGDRLAPAMTGPGAGEIIVSGGGSAAGLPLLRTALAAARLDASRTWRLLAGHKIPAEILAELQAAAPANAIVEPARPDFRDLLCRCAVSVSQFGYNTALDILASGAPAVVVPFAEGGETEQSQRAALFAGRGLVQVVTQEGLSPEALLAAVRAAPARTSPGQAKDKESRSDARIAVDGAGRSAEIVAQLFEARNASATSAIRASAHTAHSAAASDSPARAPAPAPARAPAPAINHLLAELGLALRPVDEALRRHAGEAQAESKTGQARSKTRADAAIAFWWRDDDAIAPTPQLERLLALANAHAAPLAIAAIPAGATPELAQRLAREPLVSVVVHGLTHDNFAPAGAKKAEFGHGAPADLATRAAQGLTRITRLFGAQASPVLTPPWNRISPELLPLLPSAGFVGVSTYRERAARFAAPGLMQINTHIDPVMWRGDRSLVEPAALAAALCDAISRRANASARQQLGPIGLLTHHLAHDQRIDAFIACLLALLASHQGARFAAISDALTT